MNKIVRTLMVTFLVCAVSLPAFSEPSDQFFKITTIPSGFTAEQISERRALIFAMLDPSEGAAVCTARQAISCSGLPADDLNTVLELGPWFELLRQKLKSQSSFKEVEKLAIQQLVTGSTVVYRFNTNNLGQILNLVVCKKSASPALEQGGMNLIQATAPLSAPPNKLPYDAESVFLELYVKNGHLEFGMQRLGSFPTHRIHKVVMTSGRLGYIER